MFLQASSDTQLTNQEYPSCDVSDALGKLGYGDGGFLPGLRQFSPEIFDEDVKIIGPAYTVKYSLQNDSAPEVPNHYVRLLLCFLFFFDSAELF